MASSGGILNAVSVSSYPTSLNTSSFTAVSAHTTTNTTSSTGISSVTAAAAGALIKGSRGFLSLLGLRNTAGGVAPTQFVKSTAPMESTDFTAYDIPSGGDSFVSKQRHQFPVKQAPNYFPYTSPCEPFSYGNDGTGEYSLLTETMNPSFTYQKVSFNERTMTNSSNNTGAAPAGGNKNIRDYISGLTGACRDWGLPATTWIRPDYLNSHQQPQSCAKMSRQCYPNTLPASQGPHYSHHQGKQVNCQNTGYGGALVCPFELPSCCGAPQLKGSLKAPGSSTRNCVPDNFDALPCDGWSNVELSSAQTEDLLMGRQQQEKFLAEQQENFIAEQNRQYQFYSKLHQQKMEQGLQQNQTSDDFGTVDDGWDIVTNEACLLPDDGGGMGNCALGVTETSVVIESAYLMYENATSEFGETSVGTHQFFYSEVPDSFVQEACLPLQSVGYDDFSSRSWSINSEIRNQKWEAAERPETGQPPLTKSRLNPNAKEWTGGSCSKSKLNPEAKEWVPRDESGDRIINTTKTITETDLDNDLVLISICSENVETEKKSEKATENDCCSTETSQNSCNDGHEMDMGCNRIDERSLPEKPSFECSVERSVPCLPVPTSLTSSSFACESTPEISSSQGVISCPVPEIPTEIVESTCDIPLLGLDCVDSIRQRTNTDISESKARQINCGAQVAAPDISDSSAETRRKKLIVAVEPARRRYPSETSESTECESDQDGECETFVSTGEANVPISEESSDEEDSESEESDSESEDLVDSLLASPCVWWRSGCDSEDDSSDDGDESSSDDTDDDDCVDIETDDDIVFDCSVDEADCTSVKDKRTECCLSEMQKANLRWNSQINENVSDRTSCKVSFNQVVRVDTVEKNVERSGVEWERYAMEAKRFRENVLEPHGAVISRVLGPQHREKIYAERFADVTSEDGVTKSCDVTPLGDRQESCLRICDSNFYQGKGEMSKGSFIKNVCTGNLDTCTHVASEKNFKAGADRKAVTVKTVCVK